MSFQKVEVFGVLGKNAEVKSFNGKDYLSFSISVDNGKDAQGNLRPSTWFECLYPYNPQTQAWMLQELIAKSRVIASGRVSAGAYISKQTNEPVATLNLFVQQLECVGMVVRQNNGGYQQRPAQAAPQVAPQQVQTPPQATPVMAANAPSPTQYVQNDADSSLPF